MKNRAIRILDVIPMDKTRRIPSQELDSFKLYKVIRSGVLKEDCGIKRKRSDIIVCDVSSASEEFKSRYADLIVEIDVNEIVPAFRDDDEKQSDSAIRISRIIELLPVDGTYASLTREELNMLGHNYVSIKSTPHGTKVTPVITTKPLPDNLYLIVNLETISDELREKITPELVELSTKPNNFYENRSLIIKQVKPSTTKN